MVFAESSAAKVNWTVRLNVLALTVDSGDIFRATDPWAAWMYTTLGRDSPFKEVEPNVPLNAQNSLFW